MNPLGRSVKYPATISDQLENFWVKKYKDLSLEGGAGREILPKWGFSSTSDQSSKSTLGQLVCCSFARMPNSESANRQMPLVAKTDE